MNDGTLMATARIIPFKPANAVAMPAGLSGLQRLQLIETALQLLAEQITDLRRTEPADSPRLRTILETAGHLADAVEEFTDALDVREAGRRHSSIDRLLVTCR